MAQMLTLNVRFSREQVEWLDTLRRGPLVTRSEVLRHVVADAMARERQEQITDQRRQVDAIITGARA